MKFVFLFRVFVSRSFLVMHWQLLFGCCILRNVCVGQTPTPHRVAFFVGLSENIGPVKEHTGIVFDRVVTNIGNAYDAQSGRFTSPVNATYQFNVVISAQGRQKVWLQPTRIIQIAELYSCSLNRLNNVLTLSYWKEWSRYAEIVVI